MTTYMHIQTAKGQAEIKGDVSDKQHTDWIKLKTIDFGMSNNIPMLIGTKHNRTTYQAKPAEIMISKGLDRATIPLFDYSLSHQAFDKIEIHICPTPHSATPRLKYLLENVMVSNYIQAHKADTDPCELITLNYSKISFTFGELSPQVAGFDLAASMLL